MGLMETIIAAFIALTIINAAATIAVFMMLKSVEKKDCRRVRKAQE